MMESVEFEILQTFVNRIQFGTVRIEVERKRPFKVLKSYLHRYIYNNVICIVIFKNGMTLVFTLSHVVTVKLISSMCVGIID